MFVVNLHNGRGQAFVDDEDAEKVLSLAPWRLLVETRRRTHYAISVVWTGGVPETFRLHRVVMHALPGEEIDHKNGNGLDCQKSNLRRATHAENMRNAKRRLDNRSGYKGVSWHAKTRTWWARIGLDNKVLSLGRFATPEEAYAAYCEAAGKLHGRFKRLS